MSSRLLIAGLLALTAAAGCRVTAPRTTTQPAVPHDGNAELMMYISEQPYVTADAAYRAIHILKHSTVFEGDYAALQSKLEGEGVVSPAWKLSDDTYVDRAAVGYMVCKTCDIRTGLNWTLTGLGRYAWRELYHRNIAQPTSELGLVGGGEFLGILAYAEQYLREVRDADIGQTELGERPQQRRADFTARRHTADHHAPC